MEHRKRYLNQHKVQLSTQTKIAMLQQKTAAHRLITQDKDLIMVLAFLAMKNAAKNDASIAPKEIAAEIF